MRKLAILLAGAIALAACSNNPPVPVAPVDLSNPLLAPGFMAQAASGDQFEIQSSQLALQMSQNAALRNFANMLIADHTRLSQAMAAAAISARLNPPAPALLPAQQAMLDQLRASGSGTPFDLAYQQAQIQAHQNALALMQNYAASGDVPALRAAAAQAIPTIQMHLQQAQGLGNFIAPPTVPPTVPPMTAPPPRRAGERG
jgi:putative membrane protein